MGAFLVLTALLFYFGSYLLQVYCQGGLFIICVQSASAVSLNDA